MILLGWGGIKERLAIDMQRIFLILFIPTLLVCFAPPPIAAASETSPAGAEAALRLAMSGAFQPFSTTDAEGTLVGFDADMARALARQLGYEPVLVQTDWAGIQAGLQAGKYDLICGSMAITPPRLEKMVFSLPYYVSGAQVFVRRGLGSLRGGRIGVTEDSTYARYIREHPRQFPAASIVTYGSEAEIVAAMNTGKIDAFVSDRIVGGFYIQKGAAGDIVPRGSLLYREAMGIAARRDSPALIRQVNQALLALVQDGTYGRIYRKWVGSFPDLDVLFSAWGDYASYIPGAEEEPSSAVARKKPGFADNISDMLPLLARGAMLTLLLSAITALAALVSGALIGVGTVARQSLARRGANGFIWLVRGTPLLVQLFMSYFALATLVNHLLGFEAIGAFGAALLALIVNTTAYNAETLRGGIEAVDRGQWDAAASVGMTRGKILRRIILPQAFRDSLPSLGNNLVVLVKDTSLVGAITLIELTYAARNVVFQTGQAFLPFLCAAGFYLVIISLVTLGVRTWEKRLWRSRRAAGETL
jgi:arginine/lysine/histidine/glutamine transport system substrate-binding/permease protein